MPEPTKEAPDKGWPHYALWERVNKSIAQMPKAFKSTISVAGIRATEIYTFGEALGSTIEFEFVRTLSDMRGEWDAEGKYGNYVFSRQAHFPDVIFSSRAESPILGIELKSWYLLAKEGEPSFRFKATPEACAEQDLLVVVPWALSNVISGSPIIFPPFIESSRHMAKYRNYWWREVRKADGDTGIDSPKGVHAYPGVRDEISDKPLSDKGNNFGRIARLGVMDKYVRSFDSQDLLGIELRYWREFFKTGGSAVEAEIQSKLTK